VNVGRNAALVVGIDPGQKGALAFLRLRDSAITDLEDMPCIGKEVNAHMVTRLILGYGPIETAIVEQAHSMPKQGVAGVFNYGVGYGKILGVLAALDIPIVHMPSTWKTRAKLSQDKALSRRRATDRWPDWAESFKRVKDDGRAEAALMAALWISENRTPRTKKPPEVMAD
jgi:crossover junction endodeoxyribonuclease RuvC